MKDFLKELIFWVVYMPGINRIYRAVYKKQIKNKLAEFKLSDLIVSVEPSNICNSKCVMCPYPKMTRSKEIMAIDLFRKIVDDCYNEGVRNFNLNFYNEPFLDTLIFDRIKYLKSKGLKVSLYSNGSVVNESIYDKIFESGIDRISFSVDGVKKETYEKIRKGLNFEETTKNIIGLIKRKRDKGFLHPKIRVVFVRQKDNKNEVGEYKNFWKDKADSIVISTDDNRNSNSGFFKYLRSKKPFPCRKIWTETIVMSNGKVALCCIDADGEVVLGDFNKQTLRQIWESAKFKKIREFHLNYEADKITLCKNCLHPYRMNLKSWW